MSSNNNNTNNNTTAATTASSSVVATPHAAMSVSDQQLRIHQELTAVAYAHAPAFVDAVHSVQTAEAATQQCTVTSATLQQQLTSFKLASQKLQESGNAWKKQRHFATSSSSSLSKISELLDAPHTVESCIRGGMYHEALVAIQHVRGLCSSERFHHQSNNNTDSQKQRESSMVSSSSSIPPILFQVSQQVDETVERLLTTYVLNQLAGPLIPSHALKIVIFLQSLAKQQAQEFNRYQNDSSQDEEGGDEFENNNNNNITKSESNNDNNNSVSILATDPTALPELFLSLRSEFIANEMKEALSPMMMMNSSSTSRNNNSNNNNNNSASKSSSSSFSCLQKMLAVYKVHVSESVATFKACFVEEDTTNNSNNTNNNNNSSSSFIYLQLRDLLSRWSSMHTSKLISLFTLHVANLSSGADVAMLLEPVSQCGTALSKAGLDVSIVLESILVQKAESLFLNSMDQAGSSFSAALSAQRWRAVVEVSSSSSTNKKEKKDNNTSGEENTQNNDGDGSKEDEKESKKTKEEVAEKDDDDDSTIISAPPMSLLRFPPLAHSMNSFLSGCNDVRKCALKAIRPRCLGAVLELIETLSSQLSSVRGTLLLEGPELESLRVMVKAFSNDFAPHVQKCTLRVFGHDSEENKKSDIEWKKGIAKRVEELIEATK